MISYYEYQQSGNNRPQLKLRQSLNMKQQKEKAYSGQLTIGAKKRMTRAIELLCMMAAPQPILNPVNKRWIKHRLSFITLTVSHNTNITAKDAYNNLLSHLLQWLRRTQKAESYVWKAEVQKRGQIHYHITTTAFIHYQDLRDKWNNLQRKAGLLDEWHASHANYNPNSTDIHAVRSVKNLAGYMIKEFCKAIQNPKTEGKVWDCSSNLKGNKYFSVYQNQSHDSILNQLYRKGKIEVQKFDRFAIIRLKDTDSSQILTLQEYHDFENYVTQLKGKR